jgi:hypothetical protein
VTADRGSGGSIGRTRENAGMLRHLPRAWRGTAAFAGVLLAALALAHAGSVAAADLTAPCAAATASTLAATDSLIATNIYRAELGGSETQMDLQRVTGAADLLAAAAAGDPHAAWRAAVRIVYHHFWHIVRLRVLDASGTVLADIGGPYVIAPVSGTLSLGGKVVGSFVMSVQDDLGYTILERHAIGDPIAIYLAGRRVVEKGAVFPPTPPSTPTLKLAGVSYGVLPLTLSAFPSGTLTAVLAVPAPAAAARALLCSGVVVSEIARIAQRVARRFSPLAANYAGYVETMHSDTGAVVIVRIGPRAIAGSEGPGPAVLPPSGPVSYMGRNWLVFSFAPTPPARIYLLISQP